MAAPVDVWRKLLQDVPPALREAVAALGAEGPGGLGERLLAGFTGGRFQAREADSLSAPLFGWLLRQEELRKLLHPLGITFQGLSFDGPLELYGAEIKVPLRLTDCRLPWGLNIGAASLKTLDLAGSILSRLDGPGVVIAGDLFAEDVRCGPIDLEDSQITGDLCLNGVEAWAANRGQKAEFEVDARPRDYQNPPRPPMPVDAALSLDRAKISGRALFELSGSNCRRFTATGRVYLRNAKVGGILCFNGACLRGGLSALGRSSGALVARYLEVTGPVYLGNDALADGTRVPFEATGIVDLSEARLGRLFVGPSRDRDMRPGDSPVNHDQALARFRSPEQPTHEGSRVKPSLDLTAATISGEVTVIETAAESFIAADNARIGTNLTVERSRIGLGGRLAAQYRKEDDELSQLSVRERLAAEWKPREGERSLTLDGATLGDSLFIETSILEGELRMIGATLGGEIVIDEADLLGGQTGPERGGAITLRSTSMGRMTVTNSRPRPSIRGQVFLAGVRIREVLRFSQVHVTVEPTLDEGDALIDLDGAEIGGDVEFVDCTIGDETYIRRQVLAINGARIGGGISLSRQFSKFWGEIRILNSEIGGSLQCRYGLFVGLDRPALNLSGTTVKGNWRCQDANFMTNWREGDEANCVIVALEARIGGNVSLCRKASFQGTVALVGIRVSGDLNCKGGYFRLPDGTRFDAPGLDSYNGLNLARAEIGGDFRWYPDRSDDKWQRSLPQGILNLQGAKLGRLWDHHTWWPQRRDGEPGWHTRLDGLTYDRLQEAQEPGERAPFRVKWLEWQDPARFSLQPYEHLARLLRGQGRHAEADEVAIAKYRAAQALRLPQVIPMRGPTAITVAKGMTQAGYLALLALLVLNATIVLAVVRPASVPGWIHQALQGLRGTLRQLYLCLAGVPIETLTSWFVPLVVLPLLVGLLWYTRHWIRAVIALVWNWLLDTVAAHGYRPARAILLAVYVVISGAFLFQHAYERQNFHPVQERAFAPTPPAPSLSQQLGALLGSKPPPASLPGPRYPTFNAALYSLEVFVPFLSLNQSAYWAVRGDAPLWVKYYKVLHTLLGWILSTVIALSPIPVFRKD